MAGPKQAAKGAKEDRRPQTSLIILILLLLVLGAGAGFGYGLLLGSSQDRSSDTAASDDSAVAAIESASGSRGAGKGRNDWRSEELVPLQPLVVRMGKSEGKWLRLEGAVAFSRASKEDRGPIVEQLGEDLMLFLASTELGQIASPTGLEFLRDDMNEIVQSRTGGLANRFVLKSLVVE